MLCCEIFYRSSYLDNSCGCSLYGHCDSRIYDIPGLQVPTQSGSVWATHAAHQQRQRRRVRRPGSSDVDRLMCRCIHSTVNNFWIIFLGVDNLLCILLQLLFLAANSQILLALNNIIKHFSKRILLYKVICTTDNTCIQV